MHRKLYIRTYGCQMNVYDSSLMAQVLEADGYISVDSPEEADLIIVNTCSVRKKAEDKVYTDLGRFRDLRGANATPLIGVAGCVARHKAEEILRDAPYVDLVFGPDAIERLPEMIRRVEGGSDPAVAVEIPSAIDAPFLSLSRVRPRQVSAYVTVMRGCDRFCSYCIVPHVRGREASRPAGEVLDEVRRLVARGVRDITLLGQNVNSYGKVFAGGVSGEDSAAAPSLDFPQLLDQVAAIPGLARLRFITSNPRDCSTALMDRFASLPNLSPYFHLPLQAGSDEVLRRMHRGYTAAAYLEKIDYLRQAAPHVHLSTDMIVGFPGETEEDFEETMKMVERVRYDTMFSFKYSPRDGTAAAKLEDDVPEDEKLRRLQRLQARQDEISYESLQRFGDQTTEVLVEGFSRRSDEHLSGRTGTNMVVNFVPPEDHADPEGLRALQGALIDVRVDRVHKHSLFGRAVSAPR